jgi:hypothetical protein
MYVPSVMYDIELISKVDTVFTLKEFVEWEETGHLNAFCIQYDLYCIRNTVES